MLNPHIHIRRRQNPNDALSKSAKPRSVPVTEAVCTLYHLAWTHTTAQTVLYVEDQIIVQGPKNLAEGFSTHA